MGEDFPVSFVAERRLIVVAMIREYSGGEFYAKLLTELDGPFYVDCPIEFLDVAPWPPDSAVAMLNWRDGVMDLDEDIRSMCEKVEAARLERARRERARYAQKKRANGGCHPRHSKTRRAK